MDDELAQLQLLLSKIASNPKFHHSTDLIHGVESLRNLIPARAPASNLHTSAPTSLYTVDLETGKKRLDRLTPAERVFNANFTGPRDFDQGASRSQQEQEQEKDLPSALDVFHDSDSDFDSDLEMNYLATTRPSTPELFVRSKDWHHFIRNPRAPRHASPDPIVNFDELTSEYDTPGEEGVGADPEEDEHDDDDDDLASMEDDEDIGMDKERELDQFVSKMKLDWQAKHLPKLQRTAAKYWDKYIGHKRTFQLCKLQATARHLAERFKRFVNNIKTSASNSQDLERMADVLEPTVFDIQETLFLQSVLAAKDRPLPLETQRLDSASKPKPDSASIQSETDENSLHDLIDDADADADADDELEDEDGKLSNHPGSLPSKANQSEHIINVPNSDAFGDRPTQKKPAVLDLTAPDPDEFEDEEPSSNSSEIDSSDSDAGTDNELPPVPTPQDLANSTPHKKRKREVHESESVKKTRLDTKVRLQQENLNIEKNMAQLQASQEQTRIGSTHIVNIGKSEDEDFIYLSPEASKVVKPHQLAGIQFLWREVIKPKTPSKTTGCLLSHTMGLGKTFQVINLLAAVAESASSPNPCISCQVPDDLKKLSVLIICPPALITNWDREFEKWLPDVNRTLGYVETVNKEQTVMARAETIRYWNRFPGVLIIGYEMLLNIWKPSDDPAKTDQKLGEILLSRPSIVIIDEAHKIKNSKTSISQVVCSMKTRRRIALTGTPMSNNLEEYWAMIDFVSQGYLGSAREFRARYAEPIQQGSVAHSDKEQKRLATIRLKALHKMLEPKVDRCDVKVLAQDLPPLYEYYIQVKLAPEQLKLYNSFIELGVQGTKTAMSQTRFFEMMNDFQLICNHPLLYRKKLETLERKEKNDPALALLPMASATEESASHKLLALLQIVKEAVRLKDKVLVFSHRPQVVAFVVETLKRHMIKAEKLTGSTSSTDRTRVLDNFQTHGSIDVLVISTKAGGEGANMQAANRVVIMDFLFSPAQEEQAIGRAYRLGQRKPVFVYRLIPSGTAASRLLNVTTYKTQLAIKMNEKKNTRNMASGSLQGICQRAEAVPPLPPFGNVERFSQDQVMVKLLQRHGESPFITKLETADMYRREDAYVLTAEDEEQVKVLIAEERSGQRTHHLRPTYVETVRSVASTTTAAAAVAIPKRPLVPTAPVVARPLVVPAAPTTTLPLEISTIARLLSASTPTRPPAVQIAPAAVQMAPAVARPPIVQMAAAAATARSSVAPAAIQIPSESITFASVTHPGEDVAQPYNPLLGRPLDHNVQVPPILGSAHTPPKRRPTSNPFGPSPLYHSPMPMFPKPNSSKENGVYAVAGSQRPTPKKARSESPLPGIPTS